MLKDYIIDYNYFIIDLSYKTNQININFSYLRFVEFRNLKT